MDTHLKPHSLGQLDDITYGNTSNILTRATGFIEAYDYSLNPYSGCAFGCTYCYAAFFSRSPYHRDNWGYWVRVKENAAENLNRKLRRNRRCLDGKRIYMSSVTDPYQPLERKLGLTRAVLEVLAGKTATAETNRDHKPRPKLVVQTRGPDVVHDLDLYHTIVNNGGNVQINMTVTTDDESVRRTFEPKCPGTHRRLEAITEVASSGISTCITLTPLLWLHNPTRFAEQLVSTGAERIVSQAFHFNRGRFVAMTRDDALNIMAQKLGCDLASLPRDYLGRYNAWRHTLALCLGDYGLTLEEGKSGFEPPF